MANSAAIAPQSAVASIAPVAAVAPVAKLAGFAALLSALATPFGLNGGPAGPVESPVAWIVLAAARRFGQSASSDDPSSRIAAQTTSQPVESEPSTTRTAQPLAAAAAVDQAPTAVNDGPFTVTKNTPLTLTAAQLVGNDTNPNTGSTLSVNSVGTATNGTVVLNSNGTVTFTPTTNTTATTASFIYRVKDTAGTTSANTATVTLTIDQPPTAVNDGPFTVTKNTPLTLTAAQLVGNDTDPNTGDTLSVNSVGSGVNGTAVLNSNGTVTFTPTTGYTGAASFIYRDKDAAGTTSANTATVSLTVATDQAPTAVNDGPLTVTKNTPVTLTAAQLVGNDTNPNTGSTLSVNSVGTATNGTVVLNSNGTVTFTPTTNTTATTASFIYRVKDTAGTTSANTATVTLTIDQPPTAVNDGPFTVTKNTPLTLTAAQLVGNDTDPNTGDTLSVNSVGSGVNGTAVLNTNGTVTFTPTTGYTGAASFIYRDKDAAGTTSANTATVSLTVATDQAPTAVNDGPFTVTKNTPVTLTAAQLVGNDTNPNTGSTLSVNSVGTATNGTVVLNSNGTVTFTPTTGYTGAASFIYRDKDTAGTTSTNTATVSLNITNASSNLNASITVGSKPTGVAVSPIGSEAGDIYVVNSSGAALSVIDPATNTVVHTINLSSNPGAVAVSAAGPKAGYIYVTLPNYDQVSVIDPTTNAVVTTIDVGGFPNSVAVSPTGPKAGYVYVANYSSGTVSVIDPATNTVSATINVGGNPSGVAVSPTGSEAGRIYVSGTVSGPGSETGQLSVIDPVTNNVTTIDLGPGYDDPVVAASPTGPEAGYVYLVNTEKDTVSVIDPATNSIVHTINVNSNPPASHVLDDIGDVTVSPTGPYAGDVYVAASVYGSGTGNGAVLIIDPATNTVVDTVVIGGKPLVQGVAVSPTGAHAGDVYATNPGNGTVSVID